ncbi:hypothetical protein K443DRAFT_110040, partial [Laccaria amethystina LaAM-08-1]
VCSVCFLRLQKFIVPAFFHYKSFLYCPLFETTKVCSVRFLILHKCIVPAFFHYKSL